MNEFLQSFQTTEEAIEQTTCIKETLKKEDSTKLFSNESSFPLIDNTERFTELTQRFLGYFTPSYLGNPF